MKLSELIGKHPKYISAIENRTDARPSPEAARKIVKELLERGAQLPPTFAFDLAFLDVPASRPGADRMSGPISSLTPTRTVCYPEP